MPHTLVGMLLAQATASQSPSTINFASIIGDDMVLAAAPRQARLWGTATPGVGVVVQFTGHHARVYYAQAAPNGEWEVPLAQVPPSSMPSDAVVKSSDGGVIRLQRVLFGDVIICGGQSNMQFSLNLAFNGTAEIAAAGKYASNLRLLTVERIMSTKPEPDVKLMQPWTVSSPSAVNDNTSFGVFSAECYLTGRKLLDLRPEVPVGLISSCWSGSMIQPWMSPAALAMCPHAKAVGPESPFSQSQMYNAMINPLLKVQPAAVLWHQGEENAGNPVEYRCFFSAMIKDWRSQFHLPTLPFIFVQLQPCGIPPAQRYAQAAALELAHVGMATAVDLQDAGPGGVAPCPGFNQTPACGNPNGMCHTRWKEDIATRLMASAARLVFNRTQLAVVRDALPPLSPSVGTVVNVTSKDYRTYEVVISMANVDSRIDTISINGTRECTLCCNTPAFAIEYASDAPGEHWQPLGTVADKHGMPLVFDAIKHELTLTVVVEPPWKPLAFRHAWQDAPQCMMFASSGTGAPLPGGAVPLPPFNVSVPVGLLQIPTAPY